MSDEHDNDFDELSAGAWTERDSNGVIVRAGLSSERARELAAKRWTKATAEQQAADEAELAAVLEDVGYPSVAEAPASHRLLAKEFITNGTVAALKTLLSQTRRLARMADQRPPGAAAVDWNGEGKCPTCGAERLTVAVRSVADAERLGALVAGALTRQIERGPAD